MGQGDAAAVDLRGVVDSFTRPDILGADLEEQTRACRLDLPYLGVKGLDIWSSWPGASGGWPGPGRRGVFGVSVSAAVVCPPHVRRCRVHTVTQGSSGSAHRDEEKSDTQEHQEQQHSPECPFGNLGVKDRSDAVRLWQ